MTKIRRILRPLLFLLARCSRNELIRQDEWLEAENEMPYKPEKRIFLEPEEKSRLIKLGWEQLKLATPARRPMSHRA